MKKIRAAFILIFLVLFPFEGHAQEAASNALKIKEDENRKQAANALRDMGVSFEERSLLEGTGGFGTSLLVRIPPANNKAGAFILALPLTDDFSVETGLAFVKNAREKAPSVELLTAFLGDEKTSLPQEAGGHPNKGLRALLSETERPEETVLCYLDFAGSADEVGGVLIRHGDGKYLAPLDLVDPLKRLFVSNNIHSEFEIRYNELYKLMLADRVPELALAWDAEINAISLGAVKKGRGQKILPGDLAGLLFEFAESCSFPILSPDRHYNFFRMPGNTVFLFEKNSMLILICFVGLLLLIIIADFIIRRRLFIRRFGLKIFFALLSICLSLLLALALIMKGSFFFYGLLLKMLQKPVPAADYPGLLFAVLLGFVLFSMLLRPLDYNKRIRGSFYGLSAVFLSLVGLFIALFLDFTYTPVFAWTCLFCIPGLLSKKPFIVFATALLIPAQVLGAFINLWATGAEAAIDVFLKNNGVPGWMACFQISLAVIPSILLLKKGALLLRKQNVKSLRIRPFFRVAFPASAALIVIIHALFLPGKAPAFSTKIIEDNDSLLSVYIEDTIFQESRILGLRLEAKEQPVRFDIILESDGKDRPTVYSSPGPIEDLGEGILAFMLGENPPNPFSTELVLSGDFSGYLIVDALYPVNSGVDSLLKIRSRQRIATTSGN